MLDKHVVKMPLESAQMLCTAHRVLDGNTKSDELGLYKNAHPKHPSTLWVISNLNHYAWLYEHFIALGEEYNFRYGKIHASITKLADKLSIYPENITNNNTFIEPPKCMPDEFKVDDTIQSYKNYYLGAKSSFAKWTKRNSPDWWVE